MLAERAAERVLDDLNIRDPKDLRLLEEIALARGAIVLERDMAGMEARLTVAGEGAIIAVSSLITNPQRRRFSVAHELGHLELHPQVSSLRFCAEADIREAEVDHTKERETEANQFASALLLPHRFFAPMCRHKDPSLEFVSELALEFDTSLTATGLRYVQLCDEPVALVYSQEGVVRWFRGSPAFNELGLFIGVRGKVDSNTSAAAYFRGATVPARTRRLSLSNWAEPGRYQEDATVVESSKSIVSQQGVLTLLWIDDDIADDGYYDW